MFHPIFVRNQEESDAFSLAMHSGSRCSKSMPRSVLAPIRRKRAPELLDVCCVHLSDFLPRCSGVSDKGL